MRFSFLRDNDTHSSEYEVVYCKTTILFIIFLDKRMKFLRQRHQRQKVLSFSILACIGFSVSLLLTFQTHKSKDSLYLVLNQRDDISARCEDDKFIVSLDRERNNKNKETLNGCENTDKEFEPSLRKNMQFVSRYSFNVSEMLMERLQLDKNGIEFLARPNACDVLLPTFVTALSDNHYEEFVGLHKNITRLRKTKYPRLVLIVYDIGLSVDNANRVQEICNSSCNFRTFPFKMFPRHVQNLRGYTWKPVIIQIMLQEFDFVMWLDTSIRLLNTDPYFLRAKCIGIQMLGGEGSIAVRTQHRLFYHFKEDECMFNYPEIQTGVVIVSRTYFILKYIMRPWVACALEYGCMDFPNSKRFLNCSTKWTLSNCHRFEQSTLGIITTRLFNNRRHQFILGEDFSRICRHYN